MDALLSKERIVAPAGFNRWLVPPAALAIHLCIGQAYAFSVFNLPLSRLIGVTNSAESDWKLTELGWIFTLAIVFLGLSAAVAGRWLERAGPRKSGIVSACCWSSGFFISALGVHWHALWLLYIGYGVIGGCGLGIGYITPVSTLIHWFPDRRGMATGLAIMGFGGGAMIASPLSEILMAQFASPASAGVKETFIVLGCIYFALMLAGAFAFRLPAPGWTPARWTPPAQAGRTGLHQYVLPNDAVLTASFYFLWAVLFINVTAGIGVLGQASAMSQEMFPDEINASTAAGFVGFLSLFNLAGRFAWSSASDRCGRKLTYAIFFLLGAILYTLVPYTGAMGSVTLFVICCAIIFSMYGGGFATIPAYLSDIFGTRYVGAIHGRLLTAWSAAGVAGPVLVNYIRQFQIDQGVPKARAYNITMYLMAGLLLVGFVCNLAVRRVRESLYQDLLAAPDADPASADQTPASVDNNRADLTDRAQVLESSSALVFFAWAAVLLPLGWGVFVTLERSMPLVLKGIRME